jgi:hypothetical protein
MTIKMQLYVEIKQGLVQAQQKSFRKKLILHF